ncbi:MAG: nitroreductase family protein [Methylibium sp.]
MNMAITSPGASAAARMGECRWAEPATAAEDALAYLGQRYSVGPKYLSLPAPGRDQLESAAALALRSPDHRGLRSFRFVSVSEHQRDHLGSLFAADAARRGHGADEVARARERAHNGPALLALVARVRANVEDVPDHEQWVCVGGGLMNFLNALHLMGFGAKVLSGASVRDPAIQAAFCDAGETLVAWIVAGTPSRRSHAKPVASDVPALADWAG